VFLSSFIGLGLVTMLLGPSIDQFAIRTGFEKSTVGLLFTLGSIGYLLGSLVTGRVLEQLKATHAGVIGLGLMVLALLIGAGAPSLWLLGIGQFLNGFGGAFLDVSANSVILWLHQGGPMMAALHLCFSIGAIFSPLLIARSLDWTGEVRLAYLVTAGFLSLFVFALWRTPAPSNPHTTETQARTLLVGNQRTLLVLGVLFYMSYVGVEVGFAGWIVDYGVERGLSRTGGATALGTVFFFSFAAGRGLGVITARLALPFTVLIVDVAVCVAGLLVMLGSDARLAMWFGTGLFGIGTASMFPAMLSLAEPVLPSTGLVTGLFLAGSSIGSMTLPPLIGWQLTRSGADALPVVVMIGTLVCGLIVLAFHFVAQQPDETLVAVPMGR
jgi:MFS transporter, FHS family, Na+ dependent glucose transporter 1